MAHAKYSKFQERLRLMRINRLRKKKYTDNKLDNKKTSLSNSIATNNQKLNQTENKAKNHNKETLKNNMYNNYTHNKRKKGTIVETKKNNLPPRSSSSIIKNQLSQEKLPKNKQKELEQSIILKLTMQIEKYTCELELIEEIYTKTKEESSHNVTQEECEKNLIIIQELQDRLTKIKEEFFRLTNYDHRYDLLELDNKSLYQDIIQLEKMITESTIDMPEIIKRVNYYDQIYQELLELDHNIEILLTEEQDKLDNYLERDNEFTFLAQESDTLFQVSEEIIAQIQEQDHLLEKLNQVVTKIEKQEIEVTQLQEKTSHIFPHLKLLYLSLLFTKPFKNPLANVAFQAITLRELFRPRKKYTTKKVKEIKYTAQDYRSEIAASLANLDSVANLIDNSLTNLRNFRQEFSEKYAMYLPYFNEYQNLETTMQELEDTLVHNKNKVKTLNDQFIISQRQNEATLAKVKKIS